MRHRLLGLAGAAIAIAALAGCAAPAQPPALPVVPPHLVATALRVPAGMATEMLADPRTVLAPKGWTVSVWARVDGARLEAWAPDGELLVSRPGLGDVVALTPKRGAAPEMHTVVGGLTQPHGLAFQGSTLYIGESDRIDRTHYDRGAISGSAVVADGLPNDSSTDLHGKYAHALKSVAIGRDGSVYFSVGSSANIEPADLTRTPERATIMRIAPGGTPRVFATGVRNGTGLAIAPDGSVWTAVNDRDNTAYPYRKDYDGQGGSDYGRVLQDYVDDHPEEEVAKLTAGRNLGWPYCNPDPDVRAGVPGTAFDYSDRPFVRDVQTNADGSRLDCARLPRVEQGLPAHSAPLGMSFTSVTGLGEGALVAVHGSWNRTPPRAPNVTWLPWRDGTLQAAEVLLSGFQNADGSRWGRPVDAVRGPDGALYVSDDQAGAIYRVVPAGR